MPCVTMSGIQSMIVTRVNESSWNVASVEFDAWIRWSIALSQVIEEFRLDKVSKSVRYRDKNASFERIKSKMFTSQWKKWHVSVRQSFSLNVKYSIVFIVCVIFNHVQLGSRNHRSITYTMKEVRQALSL